MPTIKGWQDLWKILVGYSGYIQKPGSEAVRVIPGALGSGLQGIEGDV